MCRLQGRATYNGHLWGRAAGGSGNNSSRSGMLFPVTGDVRANINFGSGVNTRIDLNFTDIQVHRKTTGENPVDLPNVHMNFDNNSSYGDVTRNGFSFDTEGEAIEKPYSKEFYNWRLRRMYRDAAITGHFYGPDAEGVAGKFYFVEGQWLRRKSEAHAPTSMGRDEVKFWRTARPTAPRSHWKVERCISLRGG